MTLALFGYTALVDVGGITNLAPIARLEKVPKINLFVFFSYDIFFLMFISLYSTTTWKK